jgi:hypothetical protein
VQKVFGYLGDHIGYTIMAHEIGEEATFRIPDDPTEEYFTGAFRLLHQLSDPQGGVLQRPIERQNILLSCISSFLSLESAINRLFYDMFDCEEPKRRAIRSEIPLAMRRFIEQSWPRL